MTTRLSRVLARAVSIGATIAAAAVFSLAVRGQQSPMPPGTGSISGHVVAADTGKPLRGAIVEIVIFNNLSSRFKQTTTDADGKFTLADLPAGQFRLASSAPRYMKMNFGQQQAGPVGLLNPDRTIILADGQVYTTADFSLSKFCAIEGQVTDEFGDPVPNVNIQVSQLQTVGGRKRLLPMNSSLEAGPPKPTDDRGHYRIGGLAPGEYFVEALSGAFADPNAAGGFAVTLFPGTSKPGAARSVSLLSGHDVTDVSFPLIPAVMSRVAGTLVNGDGTPIPNGAMLLMPTDSTGTTLFVMTRGQSDQNGQYVFRNIPPGNYTIQAYGARVGTGGNLNAMAFGYQTFAVEGRDLDQLTVRVPAPRTLRGRLTFDGDPSTWPKASDINIQTRTNDFDSSPVGGGPLPPAVIKPDYTFEAPAMSGLRYVIPISRQGQMLKRVLVAGQDVTDSPLDLREVDVNDVELQMTSVTTTITATIAPPTGKTIGDYNLLVFPEDESKWFMWWRYVALARPGANNTFTVRGVPPGPYVAVAVPALLNGEWMDPAFLRPLRDSADASRFTLAEGGSKGLTLTVKR